MTDRVMEKRCRLLEPVFLLPEGLPVKHQAAAREGLQELCAMAIASLYRLDLIENHLEPRKRYRVPVATRRF